MRLSPDKKVLIIAGTLLFLVLFVALAVIWPTINRIRRLNQETEKLLVYLEKKYESSLRLRSSLKQAKQIRADVLSYKKYLFYRGDELKLITALEEIADKNDVNYKIESSNLDRIADQQISMSLLLAGHYQQLIDYLADLENLDYFINVGELRLAPLLERGEEKSDMANLRLNLSLYVNQ